MIMSNKVVSVIIPTRNEERNIERCLKSIVDNGYGFYEIIVVDQESTDNTVEIAKRFNAKVVTVKKTAIYQPPARSRNTGFKNSNGAIIYNIDADMELEKGLLQELATIFDDSEVSAVIVPEKDVPTNIWAQAKAFERSFLDETGSEAARVSRREVFEKTMYNETISSGEDWYIHERFRKLGKISRSKKIVLHHTGSTTPLKEFKKKLQYGQASGAYVSQQSSNLLSMFAKMFVVYVRKVSREIFLHPLVVICFIIIRGVDVVGLILGFVISKFRKI